MATQIERIAALEANQTRHEQRCNEDRGAVVDLEGRFDLLHSQVQLMAVTVDGLEPRLISMDKSLKILAEDKRDREVLAGDRRTRKMDAKDWLLVAVAVMTLIAGFPAAVQAFKAVFP